MATKYIILLTIVAACSAQVLFRQGFQAGAPLPLPVPQPLPLVHRVAPHVRVPVAIDESGPAEYQFQYEVQDPLTGDFKNQQENRQGDAVNGAYSLLQPDGRIRIVEYSANDLLGFNALVRYENGALRALA